MKMQIESAFTPWPSLAGGVPIGLSAVMVMALLGRIARTVQGAPGLAASSGVAGDRDWRWAFLLGLPAAPVAAMLAGLRAAKGRAT